MTLFHFVCSISPNFSLIFFFFLHFLKLCQSFLVTSPHLSLTYLKLLSLCPPLFGGHYLSFTSMPYCSFSFCPFFSPPPLPSLVSVPPCSPVLSPQICIRVSSQGLRLLCLLTCSSLSQVKSDPPSKPAPFTPSPAFLFSFSSVWCSLSWVVPFCLVLFSARLLVAACPFSM